MILAFGSVAQTQNVTNLDSSRPSHEKVLGENSFEELPVYKLKNAKVLYHSPELLEKHGINPEKLSSAELNKRIIDSFAWISGSTDAKHRTNETRTAYADYYGGWGMGQHKGSARAAIVGNVQVKGVGITPMHNDSHAAHKEGYAGLHESIKEIIWGEFLNRTLPYGANRVVALIETGIVTMSGEPGVLIIREDPLRAGHFVKRSFGSDKHDSDRVRKNLGKLSEVLPHRNESESELSKHLTSKASPQLKKQVLSVDEWLYRLTRQLAKVHLQRIYHGATSESNININGQFIDYGTSTTNSGFGKIQFLTHVDPFGAYGDIERMWGPGMAERFLDGSKGLPSNFNDSLKEVYDRYLSEAILGETLINLGVPEGKVAKAMNKNSIREIGQLIFEVVKESAGTKTYDIQNNPMPEKTSTIKFTELLLSLAEAVEEPKKFKATYEKFGFESDSAKYLLDEIEKKWKKAAPELVEVLAVKSPKELLKHSIRWNNRDRPMLYRDVLRESTGKVEAYAKSNPGQPLSNVVNELVTEVLEGSQPKLGGIDASKYVPVRKLRSSGGANILEVYNAESNSVERIDLEKEVRHSPGSCRKQVK